MVALLVIVYGIVMLCRIFGYSSNVELLEVMVFGAIGGLLSVTVGYGSLKIDVVPIKSHTA